LKAHFKTLISSDQLQQRVKSLGQQISQDFQGKETTVVGVLKGAFVFMADLVRQLEMPLRCDFIRISSYDSQGKSGTLRLEFDLLQPIEGQEVLVIEDILDTGKTLSYLMRHLENKKPKNITFCTLLDKGLKPDLSALVKYVGFKVPRDFLVGYGLDYNGLYRQLPYIASVQKTFEDES